MAEPLNAPGYNSTAGISQTLNYADEYLSELTQAFPYVLYFGALYATPNNGRYRWVNSRTIEIPSITTTGRVDADRDTIMMAQRNYDNAWETKTLKRQRKWSTLVHPQDIPQTNQVAAIANITRAYNEFQKFPEMDAYTLSTIYAEWSATKKEDTTHTGFEQHTAIEAPQETGVTAKEVLGYFDQMMLNMNQKRVPPTGRILYVTHRVLNEMKKVPEIQRVWDVKTGASGINREVISLDGVQIVGVPEELMKTKYDFTTGWKVDESADQIEMCLIDPQAVITPVSYSFATLDAPSGVTEGKYLYYEESHEDVFILNRKADAIQFVVKKKSE